MACSAVLPNTPGQRDDDKVERLRREWKRATPEDKDKFERQIAAVLEAGALREWQFLVDARRCFWNLGLDSGLLHLHGLSKASNDRVAYQLVNGLISPKQATKLAARLDQYEASLTQTEDAALVGDMVQRTFAKRRGVGFDATVRSVDVRKRGRRTVLCRIELHCEQAVLRLRASEQVKLLDGRIVGHVAAIAQDPRSGARVIQLDVKTGFRAAGGLVVGRSYEWLPCNDYPVHLRQKTYTKTLERGHWLISGTPMPDAVPATGFRGDVLQAAARLKRR
jgi:hypothetical protein